MTKEALKNKLLATNFFINNNYLDLYVDFITDYKLTFGYSEKHHILQKQFFRLTGQQIDDSIDNIVELLYKDHCKAHWLLYYCTIGKLKIANAATVQYILNVYNKLNSLNKTKDTLTEEDYNIMQSYFDNIKQDRDSKYFNDDEIKFVRDNYYKYGCKYCAEQLNRSEASIRQLTYSLNIYREFSFTADDKQFLIANYEAHGGCYCADKLGKTKKEIFKWAKKLGLSRHNTKAATNGWSTNEITILTTYYPFEGGNVYKRLPNRSYNACRCMASILKLKKEK